MTPGPPLLMRDKVAWILTLPEEQRDAELAIMVSMWRSSYGAETQGMVDGLVREISGNGNKATTRYALESGPTVPVKNERQARAPEGYDLKPLDWPALLRDGVPEVEYLFEPYLPKGARIWGWGATGSVKSLWAEWAGSQLSRAGVCVSYFSEENTVQEELRRLSRLQPDPEYFRLFHRTGMDLDDERWIAALLTVTQGDALVVFDSWTDVWSGDEDGNRAIQIFDASVLKPLQAQGATPFVIHHSGHRYMFSDRAGATAGRGASSLGQKADVVLEFKSAGEDMFTIVWGKSRIGGIHQPDRTFKVVDTEDDRIEIVAAGDPEEHAVHDLAEKMVRAICTVPTDRLTTSELRAVAGGSRDRQSAALALLEGDPRVRAGVEKLRTKDNKMRDVKIWRPARGGVADDLTLLADDGGSGEQPLPLQGGEGFTTSIPVSSNPSPRTQDDLRMTSTEQATDGAVDMPHPYESDAPQEAIT